MAKDLNKMMGTGRLGRDPEMKYTPNGKAVTTFSVASGRSWKDGSGEKQEETEWINCVAWDKLAEICNEYLVKGTRVYVEGRLQTRSWDKDDGTKAYRTEVVLSDMIILSSKQDSSVPNEEQEAPAQPVQRPAAAPRSASTPIPRRNAPKPIEDDDLPF